MEVDVEENERNGVEECRADGFLIRCSSSRDDRVLGFDVGRFGSSVQEVGESGSGRDGREFTTSRETRRGGFSSRALQKMMVVMMSTIGVQRRGEKFCGNGEAEDEKDREDDGKRLSERFLEKQRHSSSTNTLREIREDDERQTDLIQDPFG